MVSSIATLGGCLALAPFRGFSQTSKIRRIAVLIPRPPGNEDKYLDDFRRALQDLGYAEARNISLDVRWVDAANQFSGLAFAVVAGKPDVIVTAGSAGVAACKDATSSIPIVFLSAGNLTERGFIASYNHPGGNITGIAASSVEFRQKLIEIAREALPGARRLGILGNNAEPLNKLVLDPFISGAQRLKFVPVVLNIESRDVDGAFGEFLKQKVDAVVIPPLSFSVTLRKELGERAVKLRLALLSTNVLLTEAGGLLSYAELPEERYRRAALLVDKILRGAKPGDLPVEQLERWELVVNRKTARAIGVTVSPITMFRADRIID